MCIRDRGNPVHNPKVKELYLKVLTGGEVVKAETPITKVSLDVTSIDFGSFPQSEKQERKFTLTNTGQHVLVIYLSLIHIFPVFRPRCLNTLRMLTL